MNRDYSEKNARKCPAIKPGKSDFFKAYRTILIESEEEIGDTLDFSKEMIRMRIRKGYEIAKKEYQNV